MAPDLDAMPLDAHSVAIESVSSHLAHEPMSPLLAGAGSVRVGVDGESGLERTLAVTSQVDANDCAHQQLEQCVQGISLSGLTQTRQSPDFPPLQETCMYLVDAGDDTPDSSTNMKDWAKPPGQSMSIYSCMPVTQDEGQVTVQQEPEETKIEMSPPLANFGVIGSEYPMNPGEEPFSAYINWLTQDPYTRKMRRFLKLRCEFPPMELMDRHKLFPPKFPSRFQVEGLVDTGAAQSVISTALLSDIKDKGLYKPDEHHIPIGGHLSFIDGAKAPILGGARLSMRLQPFPEPIQVVALICDSPDPSFLLGMDFVDQCSSIRTDLTDPEGRGVVMKSSIGTPFFVPAVPGDEILSVRVVAHVSLGAPAETVPLYLDLREYANPFEDPSLSSPSAVLQLLPLHTAFVRVFIPDHLDLPDPATLVAERHLKTFLRSGLAIPNALLTVQSNRTAVVEVTNFSHKSMRLAHGRMVGQGEFLHQVNPGAMSINAAPLFLHRDPCNTDLKTKIPVNTTYMLEEVRVTEGGVKRAKAYASREEEKAEVLQRLQEEPFQWQTEPSSANDEQPSIRMEPGQVPILGPPLHTAKETPLDRSQIESVVDIRTQVPAERAAIVDVLARFAEGFRKTPGRTGVAQHEIQMQKGVRPIAQPPRRLTPAMKEEVSKQLKGMLDAGVIEPCESPWASPLVMVTKKGGDMRMCVDFRRLNDVTVKSSYPLPRIDDVLDSLGQARYFTTLDLASGYWQVPMAMDSADYTSFVCHEGQFRFKVMPFGLCNAPATFQSMMDAVLAGVRWQFALAYLDDVVIYSPTFERHLQDLEQVLDRLVNRAGLTLKLKKCTFAASSTNYLGHIISAHGIQVDSAKVDAVRNLPPPVDKKALQHFLGLTGYYRRFVQGYAQIANPLFSLLRDGVDFVWGPDQQAAFQTLKERLISAPMLHRPDFSKRFILHCDASHLGLGAIVSQMDEYKRERPIAFASRALGKHEARWYTKELEGLAIVFGCEAFRPYLLGSRFTVFSDHRNLQWSWGDVNVSRLARLKLRLAEYDFDLYYKKGSKITNADALSRHPTQAPDDQNDPLQRRGVEIFASFGLYREYTLAEGLEMTHTKCLAPYEQINALHVNDIFYSPTVVAAQSAALPKWEEERQSDMVRIGFLEIAALAKPDIGLESMLVPVMHWSPTEVRYTGEGVAHQADPGPSGVQEVKGLEPLEEGIPPSEAWRNRIKEEQALDPLCAALMGRLKGTPAQRRPSDGQFYLDPEGLLFCITGTGERKQHRLYAPKGLRPLILNCYHDGPLAGHQRTTRLISILRQRFWWPTLEVDAQDWVASCPSCQLVNPPPNGSGQVHPLQAFCPGEALSLDYIGPLPTSAVGYKNILVVIDRFTHWVECFPTKDQTAETTAEILFSEWICRYGTPAYILSDRGPSFRAELVEKLCKRLGIIKLMTTAYNPQGHGLVERLNAFIRRHLMSTCDRKERIGPSS